MPPPRRQTRQEHDAFMARLDGLDQVERYRLLQEHKAYLDGEREVDADFRDNVPPARTTKRSSTRKPPTGKAASYAAARAAAQDGEQSNGRSKKRPTKVQPKHGTATRKFTKKQLAAIAREEKAAKEARAMARVEAEAMLRSESKERERKRLAREEKEGAVARHQALDDLKRKRARGNTSVKTKKKDERSDKEEEDADDQNKRQDPVIEETSPTTPICATPSDVLQSTLIDVNVSSILPAAPPADVGIDVTRTDESTALPTPNSAPHDVHSEDEGALDSEEDGDDCDSDGWYTESEPIITGSSPLRRVLREEGDEVDDVTTTAFVSDVADALAASTPTDGPTNSSDGEFDGNMLIAREKKKAKRKLQRERLEAAKTRVTRDWGSTTTNWDELTGAEMEILALDEDALQKMRRDGWNFDASVQPVRTEAYPGLFRGDYGPSDAVLEAADSPLRLFLFFMPRQLWLRIATESNRYYHQHLNERVDKMYEKKVAQDPNASREETLLQETKRHKKIQAEEILHCIGLLVARMLCPHKRRFADHWAKAEVGAVPKGTFGRFMSKARFARAMQNLHFTDNTDARAETDRSWKVRSVVDSLQDTCRNGYNVPPVLAFDEAMIPSRSRHNVTRQYLKDKPHKWGTKIFMTCCSTSSYCLRLEVFCGTSQHSDELGGDSPTQFSADPNSGPAAVIRNLMKVLPPRRDGVFHVVVTDRFYTSVQLALQLLARNVYTVGTVQTNKKGFPPALVVKSASRPADVPRGSATVAVAKCCLLLQTLRWWDRLPVYLLSTGSSTAMESCGRHLPGGVRSVIPCPSAMRDYHRWMGGVDIHDQLRLQRYSLQLSVRFTKYYKTIFFGLVDMAIVNAFIVF